MWGVSANEGVGVGLDLCLGVGGEGGSAALDGRPPCSLFTDLAACAFAGFADRVSALVGANALPTNLLAADPAHELTLHLLQLDAAQLLQGQLVLAAGAQHDLRLGLDVVHVGGSVL
jgi:hypothetical protein